MAKMDNTQRFILVTSVAVTAAFAVALGFMISKRVQRTSLAPEKGFVILPNCGGITLTNDVAALEYGKHMGQLADPFGPDNAKTWLVEALGYMGIPTDCDVTKTPVTAAFVYRLFRSYVQGALLATRITLAEANAQLAYFRAFLLTSTPLLSPADLPEGV